MKSKLLLLPALSLIALSIVSIPLVSSWSEQRLLKKTEEEIYAEISQLNTDKLIRKINRLEKKLPQTWDAKMELLPFYTALADKADAFSEDELIELIQRKETLFGIETAFVKMYAQNGYDAAKMLDLLENPEIAQETRESIVSHCDFSQDELCSIFKNYDDKTAVIAIKKICTNDSQIAIHLIDALLNSSRIVSDEKYVAVCLGIAKYCEDNRDAEKDYTPIIQKIFEQSNSAYVQDQAIYALARICDYELFSWMIENDSINFYTKISVIERNMKLMKAQIDSATSEDDIVAIKEAMMIHPIIDIGEALSSAIENGHLPASGALLSLIGHIQKNGIIAVDKYD